MTLLNISLPLALITGYFSSQIKDGYIAQKFTNYLMQAEMLEDNMLQTYLHLNRMKVSRK